MGLSGTQVVDSTRFHSWGKFPTVGCLFMQGGYDHFMQKEIHEQPEALVQSMRGRVQYQRPATGNPYMTPRVKLGGLVETGQTIRRSRRIMFVACGTSYHSCLAARQTVSRSQIQIQISTDGDIVVLVGKPAAVLHVAPSALLALITRIWLLPFKPCHGTAMECVFTQTWG